MQLPFHGYMRILGRTKMHEDDVSAIIEANAYVSLGKREGVEYLLFYSSFDLRTKIAVVTAVRKVVITVLDTNFNNIPSWIELTSEKHMEAEARISGYVWKRVQQSLLAPPDVLVPVCVRVHAALPRKREQLLYREKLGTIAETRARSPEDLAVYFGPQLLEFVRSLGHSKNWARDRLRYTFELNLPPDEPKQFPSMRHQNLIKLLRAT